MSKRTHTSMTEEDKVVLAKYPRDFSTIPMAKAENGDYGVVGSDDVKLNQKFETERIGFLTKATSDIMTQAISKAKRPLFTIALIAGDVVMIDLMHKAGLLDKVKIVYIDTYTLFPETNAYLHELEEHYGFKAEIYKAKGIEDQTAFEAGKKKRFFKDGKLVDVKGYDTLCKVEPFLRAKKEADADCWINGRRRDHGEDRASLHCYEGGKLNPLAFWSFEDCWIYLREHNVPYHPLHDDGFSSIGDVHSTIRVDHAEWMGYGNERKGRFVGMKDADGKTKTECGLHGGASAGSLAPAAKKAKIAEEAEKPAATA